MRPSGAHTHPEAAGGLAAVIGAAVFVTAMAATAAMAVEWIIARIWWILGTGLLCAVLTGVAVARLARWSDRRAAAVFAAREPLRPAVQPAAPAPERTVIWDDEWLKATGDQRGKSGLS